MFDPGLISLEKYTMQRQTCLELRYLRRFEGSHIRGRYGHAGVRGCRLVLVVRHVAVDPNYARRRARRIVGGEAPVPLMVPDGAE